MEPVWWMTLGGAFVWALGFTLGIRSERTAWVARAMGKDKPYNSTPHHCEGEFYYVITEKHFVENFQRRHKETAQCSKHPPPLT